MEYLQMMHNSPIPYLYITGSGYCGSTLLAFLLNIHPHMSTVSEMGGPDQTLGPVEEYLCSCGTLLVQCPFFLEVERRINAMGSSFDLRNWQLIFQLSKYRLLDIFLARPLGNVFLEQIRDSLVPLWPGYQHAVGIISRRIVHFAQAVLAIGGKEVFVDAQKDSIRIKFLRDIEQLDLKVIHLLRDVRAGTASFMRNHNTDNVVWATQAWYRSNMNAERARRFLAPHQWLRVRYEDLCVDPQGTVDCISDFVGVKRVPIAEDFYEGEHHILGNRMRLKRKGSIKLDESWKDRLTECDLDVIARIGGRANRYFGYDWPQASPTSLKSSCLKSLCLWKAL